MSGKKEAAFNYQPNKRLKKLTESDQTSLLTNEEKHIGEIKYKTRQNFQRFVFAHLEKLLPRS